MSEKEIGVTYVDLVKNHENIIGNYKVIKVDGVESMAEAMQWIENFFKSKNLKIRIKTSKRSMAAAAATVSGIAGWAVAPAAIAAATTESALLGASAFAIAGPVIAADGVVGGVGILAHRLFTANPDYTITKYPLSKSLEIIRDSTSPST